MRIPTCAAAAVIVCAGAGTPSATHAQLLLQLTTTGGQTCSATTTAVRLVRATGALSASGVVLSPGCAGDGGQGLQFGVTLAVPPTVIVGSTFNVIWSATSDARTCVYGGVGNAAALSGWPSGTKACTGAACAGPHTKPVTVNAQGSFTFALTCTNATGYAEATLVAH